MGRKAARRRECRTVRRRGCKIVNSRARRETRKPAIRGTEARATPKAQDLRAGILRVAVPRARALRVGILRAGTLRPGVRRAGVLRPRSAVLKGGLNNPTPNPTLNNLTLSTPRSGLPT